jgi:hypothetical protein
MEFFGNVYSADGRSKSIEHFDVMNDTISIGNDIKFKGKFGVSKVCVRQNNDKFMCQNVADMKKQRTRVESKICMKDMSGKVHCKEMYNVFPEIFDAKDKLKLSENKDVRDKIQSLLSAQVNKPNYMKVKEKLEPTQEFLSFINKYKIKPMKGEKKDSETYRVVEKIQGLQKTNNKYPNPEFVLHKDSKYNIFSETIATGNVYDSKGDSLNECIEICKDNKCKGFIYSEKDKKCHLMDNVNKDYTPQFNSVFFEKLI